MIDARRAAVLGSPIGHSLSPALHRAAYAALELPWSYDAIEVGSGDLASFVAGCGPEWAGLSLTMPLKTEALAVAQELSERVTLIGAANTLLFGAAADGQHARGPLRAENTDVDGVVESLRRAGVSASPQPPVVVGAGGTSRAVIAALALLGFHSCDLIVRRPEAGLELREVAAGVGVEVTPYGFAAAGDRLARAELVVSTTPAGAADAIAGELAGRSVPSTAVLLDVLYHPWPTALASAWTACGGVVLSGRHMLLHQAAAQVLLMTGQPAPLAAMASAIGLEVS